MNLNLYAHNFLLQFVSPINLVIILYSILLIALLVIFMFILYVLHKMHKKNNKSFIISQLIISNLVNNEKQLFSF